MTDQEINEAIARRLGWRKDGDFGWIQPQLHKEGFAIGHVTLPDYCRSIEAAWEIVENFKKASECEEGEFWLDHLGYRCCENDEDGCHGEWRCAFARDLPNDKREDSFETADTAPRAICLAFLKLESSPIQPGECEWLDHEPRKAR